MLFRSLADTKGTPHNLLACTFLAELNNLLAHLFGGHFLFRGCHNTFVELGARLSELSGLLYDHINTARLRPAE